MKKYSQFQEDGITLELVAKLKPPPYFVEIGAGHNGENNTRILLDEGWQGVWIDKQGAQLRERANHANVIILESFVTTLNVLDLLYGVPCNPFGVLSIDVDGNDYWIWKQVCAAFDPAICIIECNTQKPMELPYVMPYDEDYVWDHKSQETGASVHSMRELGQELGYELYCMASETPQLDSPNAFFVRRDLL